jgi:hypothetical protein
LQSENSDRKAGDDVANARRSVSRFGDIAEPLDDPILADMFKRIPKAEDTFSTFIAMSGWRRRCCAQR